MTKLIAIDDGHGIDTAGKRTPILPNGLKSETGKNYMNENLFNRAVAKYLKTHLEKSGFKTLMVAPTDADTPLETRVKTANKAKADLYISIHANAFLSKWGEHGGTETFTYGIKSGESFRIGKIIHKKLMQGTVLRDRGVKDGSHLYVIKETDMPSVLVECAFMDNLEEAKLLLSDAFRKECAKEIAQGICEAYGVKFVDGVTVVAKKVTYRVRKTWKDANTQIGAYTNLQNAKDLADKSSGYKVFDEKGKVIYEPKKVTYRVRKTWKDASTQAGAYTNLSNAKKLADEKAKQGYKVFDEKGKVVYTPKVK